MKIRTIIVGGCFTKQHNIESSKLYHQLLGNELLKNENLELDLSIIRYERLTKCLEKVIRSIEEQKPDLILFHIRPEPLHRICKLYYVYKDSTGKLIRSLNFGFLNKINTENQKFKISQNVPATYTYPKESRFHRFLIDCNYLFGMGAGNVGYGLKLYLNLVTELHQLCIEKGIKLVLIGPVSRPHTLLENRLAERLDSYFETSINSIKIPYVKCIGVRSVENKWLFGDEGIYVNQVGHKRVAKLIYNSLIENNLLNLSR